MRKFALGVVVFGAINYLLMAFVGRNLIADITGSYIFWTNALYTLIGIAGLYSIGLLFDNQYCTSHHHKKDHD